MNKTIKKLQIIFFCLLLLGAVIFLSLKSFGHSRGYELDLVLGRNNLTNTASNRQLAYWKIDDKNMGPWDTMRLAKDCDKMTIDQINKKMGKVAKYSEKSKLYLGGREYDEIGDEMFEKNKDKIKDIIKIKKLEPGAYLIKETDESFKVSKAKDKLTTRIEYVGQESARDGVLELEAD